MESFFATLISASFFLSFVAGEKATTFHQSCEAAPLHVMASLRNAETLTDAPLAPFGRPEQGWQIYAPQVAATIGTRCAPHTPRFAASLSPLLRECRTGNRRVYSSHDRDRSAAARTAGSNRSRGQLSPNYSFKGMPLRGTP